MTLNRRWGRTPGNLIPDTIVPFNLRAVECFAAELYAGSLLVVEECRYRVRLLPLTT